MHKKLGVLKFFGTGFDFFWKSPKTRIGTVVDFFYKREAARQRKTEERRVL